MSSDVTIEEQEQMVLEFLEGLAGTFGIQAKAVSVERDDDGFEVNLEGNDKELGLLIGPRGSHLVALHEVTKTMLQRRLPGAERARIRVDVGGYRQRRRAALALYVTELATAVAESGVEKSLEPMNAADRKVVHDTVNDLEGVDTISTGEEPRRRVVIVRSAGAS